MRKIFSVFIASICIPLASFSSIPNPAFSLDTYTEQAKTYPGICRLITATSEIDDFIKGLSPAKRKKVTLLDVKSFLSRNGDPFDISVATYMGEGYFLASAHTLVPQALLRVVVCPAEATSLFFFNVTDIRTAESHYQMQKVPSHNDIALVSVQDSPALHNLRSYPLDFSPALPDNTHLGLVTFIEKVQPDQNFHTAYLQAQDTYINAVLKFHKKRQTLRAEVNQTQVRLLKLYATFFKAIYHETLYKSAYDYEMIYPDERQPNGLYILPRERSLMFLDHIDEKVFPSFPRPYAKIRSGDSGAPYLLNGAIIALHMRTDYILPAAFPNVPDDLKKEKVIATYVAERVSSPLAQTFLRNMLKLTRPQEEF